jgi:hypothetical protein
MHSSLVNQEVVMQECHILLISCLLCCPQTSLNSSALGFPPLNDLLGMTHDALVDVLNLTYSVLIQLPPFAVSGLWLSGFFTVFCRLVLDVRLFLKMRGFVRRSRLLFFTFAVPMRLRLSYFWLWASLRRAALGISSLKIRSLLAQDALDAFGLFLRPISLT